MSWDNKPAQREAVKSFLVVNEAGKVDLEASVEKYRAAALRHLANQEGEDQLITKCLYSLYDQYKGAYLNMDFIKSQTVQRMVKEVPALNEPALFSQLSKRVEETLHGLTGEADDKPFTMRKGKNGGFARKADQAKPVEA